MSAIHDILRDLIEHSTLGGFHKARLHFANDTDDPDTDSPAPETEPLEPETPEQELARLRAEVEKLKSAPAPAPVSRETVPPAVVTPVASPFSAVPPSAGGGD